jgi:hypothetical protein
MSTNPKLMKATGTTNKRKTSRQSIIAEVIVDPIRYADAIPMML